MQISWLFINESLVSCLRPFSHWGDATGFDQEKSRLHSNSWQVVIASWSRWWEKRHYKLKVLSVGDFFLDRIAVASPQWENGLKYFCCTAVSKISMNYKLIGFSWTGLGLLNSGGVQIDSLSGIVKPVCSVKNKCPRQSICGAPAC
jgi:hypothetical protein